MSYSLITPCCNYPAPADCPDGQGDCTKKDICTDRSVFYGAICAIHQMPFGVGHLGSGLITLTCNNKTVATTETKGDYK